MTFQLPLLGEREKALETCGYCPKLCRAVCPVSSAVRRETLTPWGKMSVSWFAARGDVELSKDVASVTYACTGCLRCKENCDHDNPVAETLAAGRADYFERGLAHPEAVRVAQGFDALDAETERAAKELSDPDARTALVVGCGYLRHLPQEAQAALRATKALVGPIRVVDHCCGLPLLHAGDRPGFLAARSRMAEALSGVRRVVAVDPGCARVLSDHQPELLVQVAVKALARLGPAPSLAAEEHVRWHDPCHLGRGLGLYEAPRTVLGRVLGRPPHGVLTPSRSGRVQWSRGPLAGDHAGGFRCHRRRAHRGSRSTRRRRGGHGLRRQLASLPQERSARRGSRQRARGESRERSVMESETHRRRRTVATRVLFSYGLLSLLFALVAGWGVYALRRASVEADLMRSGYLPLSAALRDVVAIQDTWNTQLNHITTAENPADMSLWFDTALKAGRPKMFGEVRAALSRAFMSSGDDSVRSVGQDLMRETGAIQEFLSQDRELVTQLFDALKQGNTQRAEQLRDKLVTRGAQGSRRLSQLEQRVQRNVDALLDAARARERLAIRLLAAMAALALLFGILTALYARRVLAPLSAVTDRAKAVARGDLTPRPVVASADEIGELAQTFESMVSAIARANEQLLAAERLATIGKMAAHVTHEIRNPLSSIALNVELLEEEVGVEEPASEARTLLHAIKSEVERLASLSEQYLSVARQAPLTLEREQVGELVQEACDFMRRDLERHGVGIEVDVAPDVDVVMADEGQIKQALFNLLRNAREAMSSGGKVIVSVRAATGGGADVMVEDEGSGIDDATREKMFEPFFTTKGHGTGLGLAITRQIVEAHGGNIACDARPEGARFWIHLPSAEDSEA